MNCGREFKNAAAILLLFMVFGLQQSKASKVTLVDNGYQNVLVAISAAAYQNGMETSITSMLTATSAALMNATGNRTYFGTINILTPSVQSTSLRGKSLYRTRRDTWEAYPSFETADIRVDVANAAYGNLPYTQQSRGCGEPGDFIHVTPDFILGSPQTYGPPEKVLANEWIKYRYGVFDENGYYDSDRYPQMYYDQSTLTENVCSNTAITWDQSDGTDSTDATDSCTVKSNSIGVPAECTLTPDKYSNNDLNSSMMSQPLITLATQYCNKSSHNSMAPNKQNNLCQGRSIMDIVLSHSDFAEGTNLPNANSYKDPQYSVSSVASSNLALIILWDPMDRTSTYDSIRPSLMKFITKDFPNNSYFGMIQTNDPQGISLYPLTLISEQTDRSTIISRIKLMAFSITGTRAVNDVLKDAITMFSSSSIPIQNQAVLLLSNSINSTDLTNSCNTANSSSIQFHYITYTAGRAQNFLNIQSCPGKAFLIQGQTISITNTEVKKCYETLQNRALLDNTFMNVPYIIAPDAFTAPLIFHENLYSNSTNGTFIIDVPIESVAVYFYVEGCDMYDLKSEDLIPTRWLGNPNHQILYDENTVAFFEPNLLDKNSTWRFGVAIDPSVNFTIPYVVYAEGRSQPVSSDVILSIQATGWTVTDSGITSDGTTYPRVRIFASVKRGTTPVLNAKVEAKIYTSDSSSLPKSVILYDDGSGNPDIATEDGIYTGFYTWSSTSMKSCSIVINVTDNNNAATYPTNQYTWISQNTMNTEKTGSFQRTAQPEAFIITATTANIPPGQIGDFRVKSISETDVTFQWTAPGGNLDSGTASKYILGCSSNWSALNTSKLDEVTNVDLYSLATPNVAKTVETHTIQGSADQRTHYCAIQAALSQNYGAISPIQSYYITYSGLSTGAIAGIVVGVLLGLLLLILIVVLIWWCCSKDEKTTTNAKVSGKLDPIVPVIVPVGAISERGSKHDLTEENYQNRPQSVQSKTHSHVSGSRFTDDDSSDDGGSRYRSPSPRVVPMPPQIPMATFHTEPRVPGAIGNEYDSTLLVQHADVAVPEVIKLAEIEDVSEYSQAKLQDPKLTSPGINDMQDLPVYKHLLSKQPAPQPPPRGPSSVSSSTYSLNSVGRQTPALHNTQV